MEEGPKKLRKMLNKGKKTKSSCWITLGQLFLTMGVLLTLHPSSTKGGAVSGDHMDCHEWQGAATGIYWVEAKVAVKTFCNIQDNLPPSPILKIIQPKMLVVLRLRSSALGPETDP